MKQNYSAEKMKAFIDELDKSPVLRYCMAQRQTIQVIAHSFVHCLARTHWKPRFLWVLDAYGYLDMNDYAQQDTADTTAVEPASTADISSADYIFPSDRQYITESDMAGWDQKTARWPATRFLLVTAMYSRRRKSRITLRLNCGIRQIRPMMEAI